MNLKLGVPVAILLLALAGCGQSRSPSAEAAAKQRELYEQAIKNQEQDHQRVIRYYERSDAMHARTEALLASQEELMKRQVADVGRFEKILDTWERQQAQYQRYLDALNK